MNAQKLPYLTGDAQPHPAPLARYLPVVPEGMIRNYLGRHTRQGGLIIDPFGSSPAAILEAARAGYRVIVASNNPILTHMIRVLAGAFPIERFHHILANLAATRKGDERLEKHLEELYQVQCPDCSTFSQAKAFLWGKGTSTPYACILDCPACKRKGEIPVSAESLKMLAGLSKGGMHRARAIERIAGMNDPIRPRVEQALESYLVRPLYVLFTILNRLESLQLDAEDEMLIQGLLISAFDAGNTLWPHPPSNLRPKQLGQSTQIRENNLWVALNDAVSEWSDDQTPIPVFDFPHAPPATGGITIFPGRYKELARLAGGKISPDGMLVVLPRPNQAFWTLSAIWAGWLWGSQAVLPFKAALMRQRYDWQWYADALLPIITALALNDQDKVPVVVGLLCDYEPAFLISSLAAFDSGGFDLTGYALYPESEIMQLIWEKTRSDSYSSIELRPAVRKVLIDQMKEWNQPVEYSILGAAVGIALADNQLFRAQTGEPSDRYTMAQNTLKTELITAGDYIRYRGQHALENDIWWKKGLQIEQQSTDDRIEMAVLEFLLENNGVRFAEIQSKLNNQFTGLITPSSEIIRTVLDSYGELADTAGGLWKLSNRENPLTRQADLKEIHEILKMTGVQFGYHTSGETGLVWKEGGGDLVYYFVPSVNACISGMMLNSPYPPDKSIIVIPASRTNLLLYKIEKNPLLYEAMAAGWRIVKFRHIRHISKEHLAEAGQWDLQLEMDPLEFKPIQMKMF
ncbi:MAG: hypothetical protein WBV22_04480 [Anaerolineaceae bacterium]